MLVFLDFEASSLEKQSYPIEVGWVREDGSGESLLIKPAPGWTDWDPGAEAIHHITREELVDKGVEATEACERVLQLWDGNRVFASAPSWDGHWLSMLLRAAGHPRHLVRLEATDLAFAEAAASRGLGPDEAQAVIEAARAEADSQPVAHRAQEDARREWQIWRKVLGEA
ncbi:transcriptional regulator [Devosia sp. 1635]|uniref:3'-5' exonuclease n=1 Tax=Devosia sp. 1635 TaxID=2726066 RepID=UPI0015635A85|nr:transcriptional regulator [Devosia sp. 1635]